MSSCNQPTFTPAVEFDIVDTVIWYAFVSWRHWFIVFQDSECLVIVYLFELSLDSV